MLDLQADDEASVGVEFDNWNNGSCDGNNDNHAGIDIAGNTCSVVRADTLPAVLDSGSIFHAWVDYNGSTDTLEVRLALNDTRPIAALMSYNVDLVSVLGTTDAFVGFTSGTGAATADHDIRRWVFNSTYNPVVDPNNPGGTTVPDARVGLACGFGMIGSVMVWKAVNDPARYDPRIEALHFVFAGIVMASVATLSIRIGRLRERLHQQRSELAQALERIQALATCDELTGLTNRRAMLEQMAIAAREIERHGQPLALVLFDLDHFKQINDTRGHAAGDRVLQRFGEVALAEIRAGDVLARWGGEEFLLLLPRTGLEEAWRCAERIRTRLVALKLEGGLPGQALTFSAGVSSCRRMDQLDAAIEAADRAMYLAKATGRNRIELVAGPGLAEIRQDAAA